MRWNRRRFVAAIGALLLLAWATFRISRARHVITLPNDAPSRWLSRIVDEEWLALPGAYALRFVWTMPPDERRRLVSAMHAAYGEMRGELGPTASPALDTLFGRQRPEAFDVVVLEVERPRAAVVFLHGYGGDFALECWLVARAARAIDAVTVCPATKFAGHWSDAEGERTLRQTVAYLSRRGLSRVYLAGLSNGAVGAAQLAPRLAGLLSGLILISGTPSSGGSALPTLVLQGAHDPNMPAELARRFAQRAHARYHEFDGGHFVLLTHREAASAVLADWLRSH